MEQRIEDIRNTVARGGLEEAVNKLAALFSEINHPDQNIATNLQTQYSTLRRNEMIGILSYSEASRERNKITNSLLGLLSTAQSRQGDPNNENIQERNINSSKVENQKEEKTRILFLASNSNRSAELRLDTEFRQIYTELPKKKFVCDLKWEVKVDELADHILDYKPDILHFAGHGAPPDGNAKEGGRAYGNFEQRKKLDDVSGIFLENDKGESHLVPTNKLRDLFKILSSESSGVNLQAVFFNSCYSDVQAKALEEYVPTIIGMNNKISDDTALKFSKYFYSAFGRRPGKFKLAFDIARSKLDLTNVDEHDIPIIKLRN